MRNWLQQLEATTTIGYMQRSIACIGPCISSLGLPAGVSIKCILPLRNDNFIDQSQTFRDLADRIYLEDIGVREYS